MVKRFTLICLLATILVACERHVTPIEQYEDAIQPGMKRAEVIELLQQAAWYHQECPRGTPSSTQYFVSDLFFFGSHEYDQAEILIIRSVVKHDELIIDVVGTLESYAWHTAYADCIQRDRFEE